MALKAFYLFENKRLKKTTSESLKTISNPSAMYAKDCIMVINASDATFTMPEIAKIQILLTTLKV